MKTINEIEKSLQPQFDKISEIALINQKKVINAFMKAEVALHHFSGSTGYGYEDTGKGKLSEIFASVFNAESAVVSPLFTSGTHALSSTLMALLLPGEKLLSVSGNLYDTLQKTVTSKNIGSMADYGIKFEKVELVSDDFDYGSIKHSIEKEMPKMVYIQRSCGYSNRKTISIEKMKTVIEFVKKLAPNTVVMVDNCYGTFTEAKEPTDIGADVCVGSLIKNAGGGLAPTGAYVVGKKDLIERVEHRIFGLGLGSEVGSYAYGYREFFQGVFMAPSIVKNALMGSLLIGAVLQEKGIPSLPEIGSMEFDIIRRITFFDEDKMVKFVQKVQKFSAVDSFVRPEPWDMPGYEDKVIMASGSFVQGSSIEMSCDGPTKYPFVAYFQGGLTYEQLKLFAMNILETM